MFRIVELGNWNLHKCCFNVICGSSEVTLNYRCLGEFGSSLSSTSVSINADCSVFSFQTFEILGSEFLSTFKSLPTEEWVLFYISVVDIYLIIWFREKYGI